METLIYIIDLFQVSKIIANGRLYSSALELFYRVKVPTKIILPNSIGMFHKGSIVGIESLKIDLGIKKRDYDELKAVSENSEENKFIDSLQLTKEERRKYDADEDVYFTSVRLRELLNKN